MSPRNLAYYSIICGAVSLVVLAFPLGVIGSVLGILAIRRGEVRLGSIGLLLSVVFGIIFTLLNIFV
jgi:hypothetical protein